MAFKSEGGLWPPFNFFNNVKMIPQPLETLIQTLAKLPGLGPRSAQRTALELIKSPEKMAQLQSSLKSIATTINTCEICHNISLESPCHICTDEKRDKTTICVVENVDDLWAIERSMAFKGQYHVLGGVISAINGISPNDLTINTLTQRLNSDIHEIILALSASVDGQTTNHLLSKKISELCPKIKITTLAKGIPVGADVDYMDDGTLAIALKGRQNFS